VIVKDEDPPVLITVLTAVTPEIRLKPQQGRIESTRIPEKLFSTVG